MPGFMTSNLIHIDQRGSAMTDQNALPETGFIRIRDVLRVIPVSRSTWWAGVQNGRYPAAIKLGPKITVWRVEDIRNLISNDGVMAPGG